MNYRSISDLNQAVKHWAVSIPHEIDLIAAVPRSGLLAADLLALHLNLPLTDVEQLKQENTYPSGQRGNTSKINFSDKLHILVVDDSVNTGRQILRVKSELYEVSEKHQLTFGAVYVAPQKTELLDTWYEILDRPRVFEWNLMHHDVLKTSCMDIDGVLCRDPTPVENDDGENYQKFLQDVPPTIIPSKRIGWLVTSRLEKYRKITEAWLKKHGIKYSYLLMMDLPDKKTRVALENHGRFKGKIYLETEADLFIESSLKQADEIVRLSKKPVFCTETWEMLHPSGTIRSYQKSKSLLTRFWKGFLDSPWKTILRAIRYIVRKMKKNWVTYQTRRKWKDHPDI